MISSLFAFMPMISFILALRFFLVDEFKSQIMNEFDMSDMGLLHYFLGLAAHEAED